ncbi:MAG: flagellin lysine-N-methylase [Thiobacillus sp.]
MQVFRLNARDSFRCTGSDCLFSCCQGAWNISVDAGILEKWAALEPSPFKERLLASIETTGNSDTTSVVMRKDADGTCVMLDETGLCSIHQQSEDLLSNTYRDYPRMTRQSGARKLESAKLSCPEVVRLVLAADTCDQFHVSADVASSILISVNFVAQVGQVLEDFVKQVIAERRFPLVVRIGVIAEILIQLELKSQGRIDLREVQRLCAKPRQQLYDLNQKCKSRSTKPQALVGGRFWHLIFSILIKDTHHYIDPVISEGALGQRAMSVQSDSDYEALYQEVMKCRDKAVFELSEPNRLYGEKYLQVKFVNSGFPAAPIEGNFIATFLFCMYAYALIQLYLWLLAAHKGKISDADVQSVISRVERMFDHNDRIYRFLDTSEAAMRLDRYYQCLMEL